MSVTLVDHDGKRYLALPVSSTAFDGIDGFDLCLIEVTPTVVAGWKATCALTDELRARVHQLEYLGFVNYEPEWRTADWSEGTIDTDGEIEAPDWTQEPERTEGDALEVSQYYLEWRARPKHRDDYVSVVLWRSDLEELERQVNSLEVPA